MQNYKPHYVGLLVALLFSPLTAMSAEPGNNIKIVEADFAQVFQDLQDEVINKGLVIDYIGHVDTMLERTSEASGASESPYLHAKYFQFCSSALTHEAVAADSQNLAMCPYLVFAYETKAKTGNVSVGFRDPTLTSSEKSQAVAAKIRNLLQGIVEASTSGN